MKNLGKFKRLLKEDFDLPCEEMAIKFLGKILVRKLEDGTVLKGRIVETECYLGAEDKASSSFRGRRTPHNEPMYMDPGTSYVYMTYGMYHCFNISSKEEGATIFLRALEPIQGIEHMHILRNAKHKSSKTLKDFELCNGPSKLCIAMDISKANCNKLNLCDSSILWLEDDPEYKSDNQVINTSRVGIASAGMEWANKPLRFYTFGSTSVSKRDRKAEKELEPQDI